MSAVLVVAPAWVGDMVMAQCLFRILKAEDAGRPLDVLAPGYTLPLLQFMPEVREGIEMPLGHGELRLQRRRRLGMALRGRGYNRAIVLPGSFKSALVPFWARIPLRCGYAGEMRRWLLTDCRRRDRRTLPMTVQGFAALALPPGANVPDPLPRPAFSVKREAGDAAIDRLGLALDGRPLLVLCPGAEFGPSKQWPEEYYARLAGEWLARGWQIWLLGSQHDAAACDAVSRQAGPGCTSLAGRTTLAEAVVLLSLAALVVTNDSGLMHVAAALQRPTVAIYGSSDPAVTPPLAAVARVVRLAVDCSPCFRRVCPLGHLQCLRDLQPEQVTAAMEEVMSP